MKKQILSTFLALAMIFLQIPLNFTIVNAASGITEDEVVSRLLSAENKWKNGSTYVKTSASGGAGQCFGFARELFNYIFNAAAPTGLVYETSYLKPLDNVIELGHLNKGYSVTELTALLAQAKPGDILTASNGTWSHVVIIRSIASDASGVNIYDANWDHANGIRTNAWWGADSIHKSRAIGVTLYRYKNYNTTNTSTPPVPPVGPTVTCISFNGLTAPGTLQQGSGAHISGTISSKGSPLSTVEAEVLTSNGGGTGIKASKSGINSYSLSIYNSDIDWGLTFGKLGAGTYYIRYKATTADGTSETDETSTFQVNGNATVEPIIHIHSYERGYEAAHPHRVYMKCSTCGDVYYTGETMTMASCETCNPPATTVPATPAPATPTPATSQEPKPVVWGQWTGWSTTPVSGSDTRQVETRQVKVSDAYTEYRYGRYVDPTGRHDCWCDTYFRSIGYTPILQYSDWSATRC